MTLGSALRLSVKRSKRSAHRKRTLAGFGITALVAGMALYTALFYALNQAALASLGPSGILAVVVIYLTVHEKATAVGGAR